MLVMEMTVLMVIIRSPDCSQRSYIFLLSCLLFSFVFRLLVMSELVEQLPTKSISEQMFGPRLNLIDSLNSPSHEWGLKVNNFDLDVETVAFMSPLFLITAIYLKPKTAL